MRKKLCVLLLIQLISNAQLLKAQIDFTGKEVFKITYTMSFNGKTDEDINKIIVFADAEQTLITTEQDFARKSKYPYEMSVINRKNNSVELFAFLNDSSVIASEDTSALPKQKFEQTVETKTILGYTCQKAVTVVNSNTIELWYAANADIKAAPNALGQNLGLVLETIRNGNYVIKAEKIEKITFTSPEYIDKMNPQQMDLLSYKDEIWRSRFITIPVFKDQILNFSDSANNQDDIMKFAKGTVAVKKIKFPALDSTSQIFLDLTEQSNGDAYDRTGTVFLIPADKKQSFLDGLRNGARILPDYTNGNGKVYNGVTATEDYDPPVELMRFITPFGIKHFNYISLKGKDWEDAVFYRQDISEFFKALSGKEIYVGVFIGNYDKGGHKVNVNITVHEGDGNYSSQKVIPLFNSLNIMEMAGQEAGTMFDNEQGLKVSFHLKDKLRKARLRYITTGHGGWGNGDEFLPKPNTILLNGKIIFNITPWREDCGSYRMYNPASGNFENGLSSSDYSRSNWCPGTISNPYIIELGDLEAGDYNIQVKIPQGKPEGNSFSAWNVSGVLIGE